MWWGTFSVPLQAGDLAGSQLIDMEVPVDTSDLHQSTGPSSFKVLSVTISRDGKIPPTIEVKCPNCGTVTSIALRYSNAATIDYEGTCTGILKPPGPCKTSLLITVTIPENGG